MNILKIIFTFLMTLVTDTRKAINTYASSVKVEKVDKQDKETALDDFMYDLMKIWGLRALLPITLLIALVYLIKVYIVYICIAVFVLFWIFEASHKQTDTQSNMEKYIFTRDFIFKPLYNLKDYLPVQAPQAVTDIVHIPEIINFGRYSLFAYKLIKTNPDQTDDDRISFAEKILQANIIQKLDLYEAEHQDRSTYAKDLRTLTVADITDFGTYYLILIAYIDNPYIYKYVKNKSTSTPKPSVDDNIKDGDF